MSVVRSLEVKVEDLATKQSGVKKSENYRYVVKRLPDDVVKEGCRYSVSCTQSVALYTHTAI